MTTRPTNNHGVNNTKKYTVLGIYCDNEQPCCAHVESTDAGKAIEDARFVLGHDFHCAGVLSGHLYVLEDYGGEERPNVDGEG